MQKKTEKQQQRQQTNKTKQTNKKKKKREMPGVINREKLNLIQDIEVGAQSHSFDSFLVLSRGY